MDFYGRNSRPSQSSGVHFVITSIAILKGQEVFKIDITSAYTLIPQ